MSSLVPGGRQFILHTQGDLAEAQALVVTAARYIQHDPAQARALLDDASTLLTRLHERLPDLEAMLERVQTRRQHAGLADRVAALEHRVEHLESGKTVVQIRKDGR